MLYYESHLLLCCTKEFELLKLFEFLFSVAMEDECSNLLRSSTSYKSVEEGKTLKSMTEGSGSDPEEERRRGNNGGQDGQGNNDGQGRQGNNGEQDGQGDNGRQGVRQENNDGQDGQGNYGRQGMRQGNNNGQNGGQRQNRLVKALNFIFDICCFLCGLLFIEGNSKRVIALQF